MFLVPSQVLYSHPDSIATTPEESSKPSATSSSSVVQIVQAPRNSSAVVLGRDEGSSSSLELEGALNKGNPNQKRKRRRKQADRQTQRPAKNGDYPDIEWRTISMEHLRQHPNFIPLPTSEAVQRLESLEDIRLFRQESWQWDVVHAGRCTTSQAVAALGFLEPQAGNILGVPKSWRRGGIGAYHRLRQPALRTLDDMNAALCTNAIDQEAYAQEENQTNGVWMRAGKSTAKSKPFPFAAKYIIKISDQERERRLQKTKKYSKSNSFDHSVRMMWGNAQEATALLTALNFFWQQDDRVTLKEVGMCGAGLESNITGTGGLLVGATPDALICHPDGSTEVLEVKNHCPFFAHFRGPRGKGKNQKRFTIRHFGFEKAGVLPHYVPQLMMEMLCAGPECQSAVMVRQSATTGALVLRIKRDDWWIDEMLYWLNRFQTDFVEREDPPPANFFFDGSVEDQGRYKTFLNRTKVLESKVELLAHVPHADIQRAMGTSPGTAHLFLD